MFRGLMLALALTVVASASQAACGPFPASQHLGAYTHAQVRTYVDRAHGGDWTPYLVQLQQNLDRLHHLRQTQQTITIKVSGGTAELNAATFAQFVYQSEQFLSVAKCLAEGDNLKSLVDNHSDLQALAEFSTAAGGAMMAADNTASTGSQRSPSGGIDLPALSGDDRASVVRQDQVANVSNPLNVNISSTCESGDVRFSIVNLGESWPKTSAVSVYRIAGTNRQMINVRRVDLERGDVTHIIIPRIKNATGTVGLAIQPAWYDRAFQMDAQTTCQ